MDEKNYKYLVIYFTRSVHNKSIKVLSLYYHDLIGKIEEHEEKKDLVVVDYMLNKVLDKIKKIIDIEHFNNTDKILIATEDKLLHGINFRNVVILMTCVVKDDDDKFYPKLVLEDASLEA